MVENNQTVEKIVNSSEIPALTDTEALVEVIDCLTENFKIQTQGACDAKTLFNILVRAASSGDSIENTTKTLSSIPCGNDVRYHLDKFDNFQELEFNINQALKSRIPPGIQNRQHCLAIDLNLIPYYGKPTETEQPYIYRSQAKSGTCSFYAYATLYVINKGKRVTLAIRGVRWHDTSVAILTYLLASLEALQVKIKRLYLDRGFFSISVIRWLKALNIPFVMPAIRTGIKGGIKQFLTGRHSYKTTYTMKRNSNDSVTFDLWIVCKYKKGIRKKSGIEDLVYVVYRVQISLGYLQESYRKRFGIESSYRLKNLCRIRTTTKKPVLRLLFVGLSFLLVNIWINLLWRKISRPRKGGRLIFRHLFTFKQLLNFIRRAVEQIYPVVDTIYLPSG